MLTVTYSFPQILGCAPLHRCYLLLSNKKTSDTSDSQTVTRLMVMKKVLFSSFHVNDARFLFVHMFFHDNNRSHFVLIYSTIFSPKLVKHQGGERETSKEQRKGEEETPAVPQVLLHRVSVVIQCPREACGRLLMWFCVRVRVSASQHAASPSDGRQWQKHKPGSANCSVCLFTDLMTQSKSVAWSCECLGLKTA